MRISLLPTDTWGVGSYRCLFPGRELALQGGHEVTLPLRDENGERRDGPLPLVVGIGDDEEIASWFDADVYVLQRRMEHLIISRTKAGQGWSMADVARWLRANGKTVISDVDDWYPGIPANNPGARGLRERRVAKHMSVAGLLDTFRASDCLTVSTPALAEGHAADCADVRVLPNFLDWRMWEDVEQQCAVERPGGRVRVGWMGWLQWHPEDMNVLRGLIGPWLERNRHVDFVSIGEPEPGEEPHDYVSLHDVLEVPADRRLVVRGRRFPELARIVPNIDVGVVPLADSFFNECKSNLKGMEYAACGIPCVASPTEPYRMWAQQTPSCLLARRPKDWLRQLDFLVNDDEARRTLGMDARRAASENTIQKNWSQWEDVYVGLVDDRMPAAA